MGEDKLMSMAEAIERFVHDGDNVYISGLQLGLPCSAICEIIRQKKRDLKIWTPTTESSFSGDTLVNAGCVSEVHSSWIGNFAVHAGYGVRKRFSEGKVKLYLYSNFTNSLALLAGYLGLPFIPAQGVMGSDIMKYNPDITYVEDPWTGKQIAGVKAASIDVAIIAAQRADPIGNVQRWGAITGSGEIWGCGAAKRGVIVSAEEVVSSEIIRSDPDRNIVPFYKTLAVVEEPWGAHPSGIAGYYIKDVPFETEIGKLSKSDEDFEKVLDEWVYGLENRKAYIKHYIEKYGYERLERLRIKYHSFSPSVDYGYQDYGIFKEGK